MVLTGVFLVTAFATILTPGPNMMYVGTTGAERGPAMGALAAFAVVLGGVCYTVATAIGISAAMAAHPAVFTAIRAGGILYLVFLGVRLLSRARDTTPSAPLPDADRTAFRGGLLISLTNPQLATFMLAFLPQFVVIGRGPVRLQLVELGLTFNFFSLGVMLGVGTLTGAAGRSRIGGVRFRQIMRAVAGLGFLFLALRSAQSLLHWP